MPNNGANKLIIAHRGASKLEHENTLEAFQKAIDLKADMIELDVRKTKDGEIVVFHDPDINGNNIADITLERLNRIAQTQKFLAPTLSQALQLITGKIRVMIEIKAPGCELQVAETALKYLASENFYVISFNFRILKKIKLRFPQIQTGLIIGTWHTWLWQMIKFQTHKKEILSVVSLLSLHTKLWRAGFSRIIPKNVPLTVWTVDNPKILTALLNDKSIAGVVSNTPDIAIEIKNKIYAP